MSQFIIAIEKINSVVNSIVWGPVMLTLLLGTGIYFTISTNFLQVRKFNFILNKTIFSIFKNQHKRKNNSITPFQALTTALAGTIGTGNIVGTATAIAIGGPGALFWIVASSFFGMMTKYAEILLSIRFRKTKKDGTKFGGPMYYIQDGLNAKWLAVLFSMFGFLASFGIGNIAQINSISTSMYNSLHIKPLFTGIIIATLVSFVIIGDAKRIAKTTEKIVPFMACFYIIITLIVLVANYKSLFGSIILVFKYAFNETAAAGGFVGSSIMLTVKNGIAKGIFTNEAGLGSSPIAHAMADTDHPVSQAMWGIFEVFIDTIVICSCTGLVIISSGKWSTGLLGADLAIAAFSTGLKSFAPYAISFSILFFAFSTLISWSFYGEKCLEYILKTDRYNIVYKLLFVCIIVIGSTTKLTLVWDISDTLNGFMAIPNLIGILGLSKIVKATTKDYFNR